MHYNQRQKLEERCDYLFGIVKEQGFISLFRNANYHINPSERSSKGDLMWNVANQIMPKNVEWIVVERLFQDPKVHIVSVESEWNDNRDDAFNPYCDDEMLNRFFD